MKPEHYHAPQMARRLPALQRLRDVRLDRTGLELERLLPAVLEALTIVHEDFTAALQRPSRVRHGDEWDYEYRVQDINHAVVLKLALLQSGLQAALLLNQHGHVIEQGALQDAMKELCEDVLFLVYGGTKDAITELHRRFLAEFWARHSQVGQGEHGATLPGAAGPNVTREQIRHYLRQQGRALRGAESRMPADKAVTGAPGRQRGAATIMQLYGGDLPRFHTAALPARGATRIEALAKSIYRGLLSHMYAAKLFGFESHVEALLPYKRRMDRALRFAMAH